MCLLTASTLASCHLAPYIWPLTRQVRFSENIDFQAPMKAACESEMARFCKDVPHGAGRVIR